MVDRDASPTRIGVAFPDPSLILIQLDCSEYNISTVATSSFHESVFACICVAVLDDGRYNACRMNTSGYVGRLIVLHVFDQKLSYETLEVNANGVQCTNLYLVVHLHG